jgi:hypothetical protein
MCVVGVLLCWGAVRTTNKNILLIVYYPARKTSERIAKKLRSGTPIPANQRPGCALDCRTKDGCRNRHQNQVCCLVLTSCTTARPADGDGGSECSLASPSPSSSNDIRDLGESGNTSVLSTTAGCPMPVGKAILTDESRDMMLISTVWSPQFKYRRTKF